MSSRYRRLLDELAARGGIGSQCSKILGGAKVRIKYHRWFRKMFMARVNLVESSREGVKLGHFVAHANLVESSTRETSHFVAHANLQVGRKQNFGNACRGSYQALIRMATNGLSNLAHPKLWFRLITVLITTLSVAIPTEDWPILQACFGALNMFPHFHARCSLASQNHLATGHLLLTSINACLLAGSLTHLPGLLRSLRTSNPHPTSIHNYFMVYYSTLRTSTTTVRLCCSS